MITKDSGGKTEDCGGGVAIGYAWLQHRKSPGYKEGKSKAEVKVEKEGVEGGGGVKGVNRGVWRSLQA